MDETTKVTDAEVAEVSGTEATPVENVEVVAAIEPTVEAPVAEQAPEVTA